jgi:hypothetical protein
MSIVIHESFAPLEGDTTQALNPMQADRQWPQGDRTRVGEVREYVRQCGRMDAILSDYGRMRVNHLPDASWSR